MEFVEGMWQNPKHFLLFKKKKKIFLTIKFCDWHKINAVQHPGNILSMLKKHDAQTYFSAGKNRKYFFFFFFFFFSFFASGV